MNACVAPPQSSGFTGSVMRFIDCQAEWLGSGAWQALAMPGSTLSVVLTAFLTIAIALVGYNLLLGNGPTLRSGTILFVKIGAVLALATSWPAYRTVVYDLVTDGPAQIVSEIARPMALPGSDGTLVRRIDLADGALVQLAVLGTGNPVTAAQNAGVAPPPFAGFNAFALGGSRILLLIAVIAGLATVKIVAALMLALGPLFIAFALFDNTRSLFEGWVRVLAGAGLGAIGVGIVLGLQLALMEPWLAGILARRMAGEALPSVPVELLVIATVFAILVGAVILASARLARAFRLAPIVERLHQDAAAPARPSGSEAQVRRMARTEVEDRSRAAAVADLVVALQRRDNALLGAGTGSVAVPRVAATGNAPQDQHFGRGGLARRPGARRSRTRLAASAGRRDMRE